MSGENAVARPTLVVSGHAPSASCAAVHGFWSASRLAFRPGGRTTRAFLMTASPSGWVTSVWNGGCEPTVAGWLSEPAGPPRFRPNGWLSHPTAWDGVFSGFFLSPPAPGSGGRAGLGEV